MPLGIPCSNLDRKSAGTSCLVSEQSWPHSGCCQRLNTLLCLEPEANGFILNTYYIWIPIMCLNTYYVLKPYTVKKILCWIPVVLNYYEFVLEAGWWPWKSGRGQWACALRSWDRWLRMPAPKPLEIVLRCQLWCWYCFLSYAAGWRSAGTQTRRISLAWAFTCVWGHILTLVDWLTRSWSAGGCS